MTKREKRVINAFIGCVRSGEYSFDYACLLIEDTQRYGYLSETAKQQFYDACGDETDEENPAGGCVEVEA